MLTQKWQIAWAKFTNHEYWPWYILFAHLLPQYLYYSLRCGSWVWFTNLNTGIPLGGFFGESKSDILDKIPAEYKPRALFIEKPTSKATLLQAVAEAGIQFPFILKPDEGERGNGVAKIADEASLEAYLQLADYPLIAQEYVDYALEFGVFYSKVPGKKEGEIISLTGKRFLAVVGNGVQTLAELLAATTRGLMQAQRLGADFDMAQVPPAGTYLLLEPIGNHVRGTHFYDASTLITPAMCQLFSNIAGQMDGFTFGRFDLRVKNKSDLETGHHLRILELNGVSSDPTHIYDPALSYWAVAGYLARHLHRMYLLAQEQRTKGHKSATLRQVRAEVRRHKSILQDRALLTTVATPTYSTTAQTLPASEIRPNLG